MTTNTDGRVTVRADALHRILTHAAPFVGTDDMLPVLRAVRIYVVGADLVAEATDRFVACRTRVPIEEGTDVFSVLVPHDDVKRLLVLAKTVRPARPNRPVVLELADGCLTISDDWIGTSLTCKPVEQEYPRIGMLIDKARDAEPGQRDVIHLNPGNFATLVKALGKGTNNARFKLPKTDNGGAYVTVPGSVGDGFEALLMLRRAVS